MMQRGYSRDHRSDCKQLVIALIVNVEGFPFSYETFDGNRRDVRRWKQSCAWWSASMAKRRRVLVSDRGIVSEENLAALRKRGAQYLVGTVRKKLKEFEREMLEGGWEQVRPEVEVKLVAPTGRGGNLRVVSHGVSKGEGKSDSKPVLDTDGDGSEQT